MSAYLTPISWHNPKPVYGNPSTYSTHTQMGLREHFSKDTFSGDFPHLDGLDVQDFLAKHPQQGDGDVQFTMAALQTASEMHQPLTLPEVAAALRTESVKGQAGVTDASNRVDAVSRNQLIIDGVGAAGTAALFYTSHPVLGIALGAGTLWMHFQLSNAIDEHMESQSLAMEAVRLEKSAADKCLEWNHAFR